MAAAAGIHVKGTPVNGLTAFIRQELSAAALARLKGELPAQEARLLSEALLANEAVPLESVNRLTLEAAQAAGQPVYEFARQAGHYGAELGTRGVYKFMLMLLSPHAALRAAPGLWARVYDGGCLNVEVRDGWGRLQVDDFPADLAVCGRITGWFEFIGERAARGLVVTHEPCRVRGGACCAWEFTWPT